MLRIVDFWFVGGLLALAVTPTHATTITNVTPDKSPANTGATIVVSCTDCGYSSDRVYFPGLNNWVNPVAWTLNTSVTVPVPQSSSGFIQLQKQGVGPMSNSYFYDISFNYSGARWTSLPFSWRLHTDGAPGCTFAETRDALSIGYQVWGCASGLTTTYGGTTTVLAGGRDGVNARFWRNYNWQPSEIAVARWFNDASGTVIEEADIGFNSLHFTWSCAGAPTSMDVQHIGTHEEGHTIGLLDMYGSTDAPKTMYGLTTNGAIGARTLHMDDVLGAEFMYPHGARANMVATTPSGWSGPIVPRNAAGSPTSVTLPPVLNGNTMTYLNVGQINDGGDCLSPHGLSHLYRDDEPSFYLPWTGLWGTSSVRTWNDLGVFMYGGRHTLKVTIDPDEEHLEWIEDDNIHQAQFAWSPTTLTNGVPVNRSAPPVNGPFAADNCDGMSHDASSYWAGVAVIPRLGDDDYDVVLFDDDAAPTTGFAAPLASSFSANAATDFVLWNGNHSAVGYSATRFAGITRYEPGTEAEGGVVVEATSQITTLFASAEYGSTAQVSGTCDYSQIMKIVEVHLGDENVTYRFELDTEGTADLDLRLYAAGTAYFHKSSHLASSVSSGGGVGEALTFKPSTPGYYAIVVHKKNYLDLDKTSDFTLTVGPALSDLIADFVPSGWSAPVVPRNTTGATTTNAQVTPVLDGNAPTTYLNVSARQVASNPTPSTNMRVFLDVDQQKFSSSTLEGLVTATSIANNSGVGAVRGGRHSLTHHVDFGDAVLELNEGNNVWSGQWVWSPLDVTSANPVVRAAPPDDGGFIHPNADGLRYARGVDAWVVASAGQNPLDDYDLYVYSDYSGSTSGYSNLLQSSMWGDNATDFVAGHYLSPATILPAVVRHEAAGGGGMYAADQNNSAGRVSGPFASFGGELLAANRLANVYEALLEAGQTIRVVLHRTAGMSDLQFEVFPPTAGMLHSRGTGAQSLVYGADSDTLEYVATESGYHPLVIHRSNGTGAGEPLSYDLHWSMNLLVDVQEAPATPLGFQGAAPNPVRDHARFTFSLPRAGRATLELFDLGGRRVSTVLDEHLEAGHHVRPWDRRGDDGSRLAAGLYWARFRGDGQTLIRRVSVLD